MGNIYILSIPICLSTMVLIDTVINTIWYKNDMMWKVVKQHGKMSSYFITAELKQLY